MRLSHTLDDEYHPRILDRCHARTLDVHDSEILDRCHARTLDICDLEILDRRHARTLDVCDLEILDRCHPERSLARLRAKRSRRTRSCFGNCSKSTKKQSLLGSRTLAFLLCLAISPNLHAQKPDTHAAPELAILDTDTGDDIDDAFALGLALTSPELRLIGITSAWGDTALRTRMIDRILCETGREDIPVATGVATHRAGAAAFSQAPWARAGQENPKHHEDAVTFLLQQATMHPGEITLIAIAPLTNLGAAIDRDPATFRKFKRVVLMGGSVYRGYDDPGPSPEAEYNIAMDPAAAQKLFHSGVPIFMMPLDSTQIAFDAQHSSQFASISTPLTDTIEVLTAEWSRETHRTMPTLFDAVAVAYAIDPATCPVTPVHIEVDDHGFTRPTPGAPNAQACLQPRPEAFFSLLMPRLLNQRLAGANSCVAHP